MGFLSLKDSGTSMAMAWGRLRPDMTKNSSTLSSEALSLMPGWMMGLICFTLPSVGVESTLSRASIQARLPRMVLISPLCANSRKGCARLQVGKVLVLKRECTTASPLVKYGWVRSGKYSLTCTDESIPLYTMFLLDRDTI